jgi:hypothetical protein
VVSVSNVFCAISFHSEITAGSADSIVVSLALATSGAVVTNEASRTAAVPLASDRRAPTVRTATTGFLVASTCLISPIRPVFGRVPTQ